MKNGDLPMKNGDLPIKNGDLAINNEDFSWMGYEGTPRKIQVIHDHFKIEAHGDNWGCLLRTTHLISVSIVTGVKQDLTWNMGNFVHLVI